ncbi:MAG: hypothetical protein ACLVJO_04145 [[Clostridium] scindens]
MLFGLLVGIINAVLISTGVRRSSDAGHDVHRAERGTNLTDGAPQILTLPRRE